MVLPAAQRPRERASASAPPAIRESLKLAAAGLTGLYGDRIAGAFLFGSHARGEAQPDSDVDILVVLHRLESHAAEIERTSFLRADLANAAGTTVSFVFATADDWSNADTPFFATVREDAVAL